jgi:hypothetical protein
MFFPLVNAPKVMSGALSWRRQIAVNQRRMMQNAVREIVGNLLQTLRLPNVPHLLMLRAAKRAEYNSDH